MLFVVYKFNQVIEEFEPLGAFGTQVEADSLAEVASDGDVTATVVQQSFEQLRSMILKVNKVASTSECVVKLSLDVEELDVAAVAKALATYWNHNPSLRPQS